MTGSTRRIRIYIPLLTAVTLCLRIAKLEGSCSHDQRQRASSACIDNGCHYQVRTWYKLSNCSAEYGSRDPNVQFEADGYY